MSKSAKKIEVRPISSSTASRRQPMTYENLIEVARSSRQPVSKTNVAIFVSAIAAAACLFWYFLL